MIPERSVVSNSAKSVFFEDVNDIDIYIEDTVVGYAKIFETIFSRAFDNKYRIEKVFPLGGKQEVIEQYESQEGSFMRPSLFVIDGDLYVLTGEAKKSKKGLYIMPFYCIENILIDPDAIHDLMNEEEPVVAKNTLIDKFAFRRWLNDNEVKLFQLFLEYALTFTINPSEQTVGYSVRKLVASNTGNVDINKLNQRIAYLQNINILKIGHEEYANLKTSILKNFQSKAVDKLDSVSGKDYLIPLINMRFKSIVKTNMPNINFKLRLAMKCSIEKIKDSTTYVAGV